MPLLKNSVLKIIQTKLKIYLFMRGSMLVIWACWWYESNGVRRKTKSAKGTGWKNVPVPKRFSKTPNGLFSSWAHRNQDVPSDNGPDFYGRCSTMEQPGFGRANYLGSVHQENRDLFFWNKVLHIVPSCRPGSDQQCSPLSLGNWKQAPLAIGCDLQRKIAPWKRKTTRLLTSIWLWK